MSQVAVEPADALGGAPLLPPPAVRDESLLRELLRLALPVLGEHVLHILVGLNDTYLANHLPMHRAEATAAVGSIAYIFWFIGLFAGAIATGSTAIIAREIGARHRRRANSACGQSMLFAAVVGLALSAVFLLLARPIVAFVGLEGIAHDYALTYLRILSFDVPFLVLMFVANACLRGAGDTLTPAVAMITVDVVNIVFTWGFTRGLFGLPNMGFTGIAI